MVASALAGSGQGLPAPQALYPFSLYNGENVPPTNTVSLAPGETLPIPAGTWAVSGVGDYHILQFLDPVSNTWRPASSSRSSPTVVLSDGFNVRVANMTGCAVSAIVTTAGSNYVQGSTTVTPSAGNSQWQPVVGGAINVTVSISNAGYGYTIPPIVEIAAPPTPGVCASAIAVLSSGTVSSITVLNQGAGYPTAPSIAIVPVPTDPAYLSGAITTNATAVATLTGAGTLTAVLCNDPGSSFSTVPSLTIAGAGTSAAATIVPMWTLTGISITSGGGGFPANVEISTVGGVPSATSAILNPAIQLTGYIPRKASVLATSNTGTIATISTIYDGGLFAGTPIAVINSQGGLPGTVAATIALTLGSVNTTVLLQKLG